jgi:hypothetical protein
MLYIITIMSQIMLLWINKKGSMQDINTSSLFVADKSIVVEDKLDSDISNQVPLVIVTTNSSCSSFADQSIVNKDNDELDRNTSDEITDAIDSTDQNIDTNLSKKQKRQID